MRSGIWCGRSETVESGLESSGEDCFRTTGWSERKRSLRHMTNMNAEHPEYKARKAMWRKYRDLYAGGEQMRTSAANYLTQRQKEPGDVYSERLNLVFYENYIGSIIDWYAATLFRREPQLLVEGPNRPGRTFFSEFAEN